MLCEKLEVSPSGYHQNRQRRALNKGKPGVRIINDALLAHIKAIHAQVKGEYGWPRIWKQLLANGIRVGKERIRKLMALHGNKAKTKRKFKATTNSAHRLPVAPNLIERDFSPALPNQVWTTDITYLATYEGWLYLTVMLDLFSHQMVGWSIQPRRRSSWWMRCAWLGSDVDHQRD